MKATVKQWQPGASLTPFDVDAKETPAPRHNSASGYGNRIPAPYMVRINDRWRRVYVCQYSNAGTAYVGKPGAWQYTVEDIAR